MKKIGILSFINAYNYGGILQIYALQNVLSTKCKTEIINYNSEFIKKCYASPSFSDFLNLRFLYKFIFRNAFILYNKTGFEKFKKERLILSEKEYLNDNFNELASDYDGIIVGSDQVWSLRCNGNDLNYFLPFESKKAKKYSYAASIGSDEISDELENAIKKYLPDFKEISLREKSGKDAIEKKINKDIFVNCDPTLLLTKKDWEILCKKRLIIGDYVLLYMLYEDKKLIKLAKKIAREKHMKVIYINNRFFKSFGVSNMSKVTPEEWVNLFYYSSFVLTNSFHGIAFSINFNKQFKCRLLPFQNKANSRIVDILNEYNLESCLNESMTCEIKDFTHINNKLKKNRENSMGYLEKICKK